MDTIKKTILLSTFIVGIFFAIALSPIPKFIHSGDFLAYWSASYLLGRGENFADPQLILETEQIHRGRKQAYPLMTWNPPWLLVLLLPYTFVPLTRAIWLWFWTSLAMLLTGTLLLWRILAQKPKTSRLMWIAALVTIIYVPVLLTLMMGQINTLVFFGLALFLYFEEQDKPFAAGASLALTLVKPHLVYIALPLILLAMWKKRRLNVIVGLASATLFLTAVALFLRPTLMQDYLTAIGNSRLLFFHPATLSGFLTGAFGWQWSKFILLLTLPTAIALWFHWRDYIDLYTLTSMSLLASLISSPFGWSYDFVVLLIPILQMVVWLIEHEYSRWRTSIFATLLIIINAISYIQRFTGANEMYYFWMPIAVSIVYAIMYWQRKSRTITLSMG